MSKARKPAGTAEVRVAVPPPPRWARGFIWAVWAAAGILALCALVQTASESDAIGRYASQGWGQYATAIVANKIRGLWHAAFMAACAAFGLWWMVGRSAGTDPAKARQDAARDDASGATHPGQEPEVCPGSLVPLVLILLVAADAWWLSRDYVKTMPLAAMEANPVIALLKQDIPEHRVALVSQDGFYNWWMTYLFPRHGILTVNVTQMPRMPSDYKAFLGTVGRNPLRFWQLSAVGYVLAPAQVWRQVQHDPAWSNAVGLVYGYDVGPAEAGVSVNPVLTSPAEANAPRGRIGDHVVLRLLRPAPRFAVIGALRQAADDEALKLLGSPSYELFREVLVAPATAGDDRDRQAAQCAALTQAGIVGTCRLVNYRAGRMEIAVKADKPGILRVSEKYDKDWIATVDGQVAPVWRVDFIVQGVPVPAGEHQVVLRYAPVVWPLYVQGAAMLVVLGAVVWLVVGAIRAKTQAAGRSP